MLKSYTNKLSRLLENNAIAFYWAGFITADGYLNHNTKRLTLTLSSKDHQHLKKFATFIEYDHIRNYAYNGYKQSHLAIQNKKIISQFIQAYSINPRKTYNPNNIDFNTWSKRKIYCFLIGFIDGDGTICKQSGRLTSAIRIKCHKNWKPLFDTMNNYINHIMTTRLNRQGYCVATISHFTHVKHLKKIALQHKLPIMTRKWDTIDLKLVTKTEKARINEKKVLALKKKGKINIEIARQLKLSKATITQILKRCKNAKEYRVS